MPRVGVAAAYFRRWWGNLHVTQNRAVTPADFDPYCITAPLDSRLPGGGGNQICGLYDVSVAKFGLTDNLITFADNFGKESAGLRRRGSEHERAVPQRSARRRRHQHRADAGPTPATRRPTRRCRRSAARARREPTRYCDVRPPFLTQYKFYGSYPLPWFGSRRAPRSRARPGR